MLPPSLTTQQVPDPEICPVPLYCSEWLLRMGSKWWGHRYAAMLRAGLKAKMRTMGEMEEIVQREYPREGKRRRGVGE